MDGGLWIAKIPHPVGVQHFDKTCLCEMAVAIKDVIKEFIQTLFPYYSCFNALKPHIYIIYIVSHQDQHQIKYTQNIFTNFRFL